MHQPGPPPSASARESLGRSSDSQPPSHADSRLRSGVMFGRFVLKKAVAFLKKEDGPTAVEYAVMLALILIAILAAVTAIGTQTSDMYNDIALQGVKVPP